MIMDIRIVLLCVVAVYGKSTGYNGRADFDGDDGREASNLRGGLIPSVDFSGFFGLFQQGGPPKRPFDPYTRTYSSEQHPFHSSEEDYSSENKEDRNGAYHYASDYDVEGRSYNSYRKSTNRPTSEVNDYSRSRIAKASEVEEESSYKKTKSANTSDSTTPYKSRNYGSDKWSSSGKKWNSDDFRQNSHKDAEMILPQDKALFLPLINGKPKPYDGYRALHDAEGFGSISSIQNRRISEERERRLGQGEIIYGKPRIALSPYHHKLKRSPAEYYGGIHPYYDYSDSKLHDGHWSARQKTGSSNTQKRNTEYHGALFDKHSDFLKFKNDDKKPKKMKDHDGYVSEETFVDSSEEASEESTEDVEYTKTREQEYGFNYNDFNSGQEYPYDRSEERTQNDENFDSENRDDEYTRTYEKSSSERESNVESSETIDKYSVDPSITLQNNTNDKQKTINNKQNNEEYLVTGRNSSPTRTQIPYSCKDPKTGHSSEQCIRQNQVNFESYNRDGTNSVGASEIVRPVFYRHKRSSYRYSVDPYESEQVGRESRNDADSSEEYNPKPRKKNKSEHQYRKSSSTDSPERKHPKQSSNTFKQKSDKFVVSWRGKNERRVEPANVYGNPMFTYDASDETVVNYGGPSEYQDSPQVTFDDPEDFYEYNNEDYNERVEENEESKEKNYQTYTERQYHNQYKHNKPSKYSYGEFQENANRAEEYRNHRYGSRDLPYDRERQNSKVTPTNVAEKTERRGPYTFPETEHPSEGEAYTKEENIGKIQVFKTGEFCQKRRKEGMICTMCKNEKTSMTFESCQYVERTDDKYYSYGSQKFRSNYQTFADKFKDMTRDQRPEKSGFLEKKVLTGNQSNRPGETKAPKHLNDSPSFPLNENPWNNHSQTLPHNKQLKKFADKAEVRGEVPSEHENKKDESYNDHFYDSFSQFSQRGDKGYEGNDRGDSESEKPFSADTFSNSREFQDENFKSFESYRKEAPRPKGKTQSSQNFFQSHFQSHKERKFKEAQREFAAKDNCRKIIKNKLTCYECIDNNGNVNDECSYVETSRSFDKSAMQKENNTESLRLAGPENDQQRFDNVKTTLGKPGNVVTRFEHDRFGENTPPTLNFEKVVKFPVLMVESTQLPQVQRPTTEQTITEFRKKNRTQQTMRNVSWKDETVTGRHETPQKKKFSTNKSADDFINLHNDGKSL